MSSGTIRRFAGRLRRLATQCDGSLTIPAIIFFAALMAVGGLAIDLQRLYGVHGQMQAFVDDAALAGAAELDGEGGALTRSTRAACGTNCGLGVGPLVTGPARSAPFATDTTLTVQKVTFLSTLGADPGPIAVTPAAGDVVECTYSAGAFAPAGCDTNAAKEKSVKYVEVVAAQRTVNYVVLPVADVILGIFGNPPITNSATVALKATAGYKKAVCDITPMMVCNPAEPMGNADTNFPFAPVIGQQILMKAKGNGAAWGPGDFGLVNVAAGAAGNIKCNAGGASSIRCMLALVDPLTQCLDNDQVDLQPGQDSSVAQGFNVRFDIYEGAMQQNRTDPAFAPSANVTKGMCKVTGNGNGAQCNYGGGGGNGGNACPNISGNGNGNGGFSITSAPNTTLQAARRSMPLPRDSNISQAVRFGNGNWARATYWAQNHGGAALPGALAGATRYQVYRYEIDNNLIPNIANGEQGGPACSTQPPINTPNRDRRTLTMAVVNCIANNVQGSKNGVNAVAYAQMFLTEPVGLDVDPITGAYSVSGNTSDYFAEVVSKIKPNDQSGVFHIYPVLYR